MHIVFVGLTSSPFFQKRFRCLTHLLRVPIVFQNVVESYFGDSHAFPLIHIMFGFCVSVFFGTFFRNLYADIVCISWVSYELPCSWGPRFTVCCLLINTIHTLPISTLSSWAIRADYVGRFLHFSYSPLLLALLFWHYSSKEFYCTHAPSSYCLGVL